VLAALAERLGSGGRHSVSVNACSSGNPALAAGCDLIRRGEVEAMVVGGVDVFAQTEFTYFHNLRSLAPERCQPFDRNRRGLTIGEGTGMLVLEPFDRAIERGAPVYAEVKGYGLSADGFHVTSPEPSGAGASRAMNAALRAAALSPADIDYVSAHGTGTPANDRAEAVALRAVFGERAGRMPGRSVKSMVGHFMGAAGAIEPIACFRALPGAGARPRPPDDHLRGPRSRLPARLRSDHGGPARDLSSHEQLLRVRRQQRRRHLRQGVKGMATTSRQVVITGVGIVSPLGC